MEKGLTQYFPYKKMHTHLLNAKKVKHEVCLESNGTDSVKYFYYQLNNKSSL